MGNDDDVHTPPRHANGQFAAASFDAVYAEIKRLDQLRAADQTALVAALAAADKAVSAALVAAEKAVNKAEAAQLRTNEGQNEFRGQLKDQAATFLPRGEFALSIDSILGKIEDNADEIGTLRSRIDVGPPSLATLQSQSDEARGNRKGGLEMLDLIRTLIAMAAAAGVAIVVKGGP